MSISATTNRIGYGQLSLNVGRWGNVSVPCFLENKTRLTQVITVITELFIRLFRRSDKYIRFAYQTDPAAQAQIFRISMQNWQSAFMKTETPKNKNEFNRLFKDKVGIRKANPLIFNIGVITGKFKLYNALKLRIPVLGNG